MDKPYISPVLLQFVFMVLRITQYYNSYLIYYGYPAASALLSSDQVH